MKHIKQLEYKVVVSESQGNCDITVISENGISFAKNLAHEQIPQTLTEIITVEAFEAFGGRCE